MEELLLTSEGVVSPKIPSGIEVSLDTNLGKHVSEDSSCEVPPTALWTGV